MSQSLLTSDKHHTLSLADAFLLADAACTDDREEVRSSARRQLGYEIMKHPELAAPLAREILDVREKVQTTGPAAYRMLLTIIENSRKRLTHYPTIMKIAETACFNTSETDRAVAGWAILRNLEAQ
jgi:hypothetical protein